MLNIYILNLQLPYQCYETQLSHIVSKDCPMFCHSKFPSLPPTGSEERGQLGVAILSSSQDINNIAL